ncbi:MAG: UDP-N-acetylglucosamine 2-epimerase, partial [bacterium]|nr:UDP-N-acetylglucosamine 2-epimerase [bacterium]
MKIVSIVGGRPNFIKLAAVSPLFEKRFKHLTLHSGQHYNYGLSQSFFEELNISTPNENLNVGSGSQAKQTAEIMIGCEKYFLKNKITLVVVYGDMNSALGASLAAAKLNIPIVHIEAGIRSFDNSIPEEINRKIVDHISILLFAPTKTAKENLIREGLKDKTIVSGDTTYDTFLKIEKKLSSDYYKNLNLKNSAYFVATIHRPSNSDIR